jgi:exodeoxyribonuclease V beta subunit
MSATEDATTVDVAALEGLLVVAASAGTGKTWAVTHLAARWLVETDGQPSELLMVTFSRAAAGELRSRLREHLARFGDELDGTSSSDEPWARALRARADELGIELVRKRQRAALSSVDEVHARTIHSFASAVSDTGDALVVDGRALSTWAAHEAIARQLDEPTFIDLVESMESSGDGSTPAVATLVDRSADALRQIAATGGDVEWYGIDAGAHDDPAVALTIEARERYEALCAREGVVTYDQLITTLRRRVEQEPALVEQLRRQFSLCLIDEFQDTDATQWAIFRRLFLDAEVPTPVIVVGDPKQAIYGFRGGDVTVFQEVEAAVRAGRGRRITLSVNQRSSGSLVEGLNGLFAATAGGWPLSLGADAIEFEPVESAARHASVPGYLAVRTLGGPKATLAADVVQVTREFLDAGASPSEIAVLCAGRGAIRDVEAALDRGGWRTTTPLAESVLSSYAARQVRALLYAITEPSDSRRARLLDASWFFPLGADGVAELRDALRRGGASSLSRVALNGEVLAALMTDPGGERNWTDLGHVLELLAGLGVREPASALRALDDLARREDEESASTAQRRIESDADAIRLLTIHASKGLEFPIVLVPEIELGNSQQAKPRLLSWNVGGRRHIDARSLRSNVKWADVSPDYADWSRGERRRLIYVALTRAERACVAWTIDGQVEFSALLQSAGPGAPPEHSRDGLTASGAVVRAASSRAPAARAPRVMAAPTMDESNRRWSYSAIVARQEAHAATVADRADDADAYDGDVRAELEPLEPAPSPGPDPFAELAGASFGRAVHATLERTVGQMDASDARFSAIAAEELAREGLHADDRLEVVVDSLRRSMARPLGTLLDGLTLDSLAGARRTATEVRYTLPLGGDVRDRLSRLCALAASVDADGPFADFFVEAARAAPGAELAVGHLTGSLDLVVDAGTDPTHRFVVVDYKTNRLSRAAGYSSRELALEMAGSGYPLQALLYLVALHRHLRCRLVGYDPERHLAGATYLYLRGMAVNAAGGDGVFEWPAPAELVVAASDLLAGFEP